MNLSGVFYSLRAEVEVMLQGGGGSIINMASIYGLVGMPVNIAYTAAKHGVVGVTRAAALAYAQDGIRINAVAPAVIETPLLLKSPEEVWPRSWRPTRSVGSARSTRWRSSSPSSPWTARRSAPWRVPR